MQDRPDAVELLDTVAEFLFAEVRSWVSEDRRFDVLVAANSVAIVARELSLGRAADEADLALFSSLLGQAPGQEADLEPPQGEDDAAARAGTAAREAARALADKIRAGELDPELSAVIGRLREHVSRKLEVTHPGYEVSPRGR